MLRYTVESSDTDVATAALSGSTLTVTAAGKGSATVTLMADDRMGGTKADVFRVRVPNRKPEVDNEVADVRLYVGDRPNKEEIDISGVFSDPDGDALRHTVKSSDTDVAVAVLSGTTLTVTARGKGRARVTLTADDRMGGTKDDVFEVRVPNRRPTTVGTIPDDYVEVGDDGSVDVTGYFRDPDGDRLTYTSGSSNTDKLTVNGTGSPVRFTGVAEGSAEVTVTARDGGGLTAQQRFDVEVYEPTTECAITSVGTGNFTVGEHKTAVGTVSVSASDCGTLDYALAGAGASDVSAAAVSANNDNAAITGSFNFEGRSSYDLTLTVSERGGSASRSGRVRIAVTDENDAPKAKGAIARQTVRVGSPGSVNVTGYFTDEDAGDRLTFTSVSSATGKLTVSASGSPVTLTGVEAGSATVTVTAKDRGGLAATQTIPVTVLARTTPQCAITVSDGDLEVREDAVAGAGVDGEVTVTATGTCGTLSYALTGTGSGDFSVAAASATDDDAKIKVAKTLNHEGRDAYDLTLTVSSGSVSGTADVDISVTDVNEAPKPKGTIVRQTIRVGSPGSVNVANYFTDEDAGDRLTFTSVSSATGKLTVNASGSPVALTGVAPGSATVTVTAKDRAGLTATQTIPVTVLARTTTPCGITVSDGDLEVREDAGSGAEVNGKVSVTTSGTCGTLSYALTGTGSGDFSAAAAGAADDDAKIKVAGTLDHETRASYALTLTVSSGSVSGTGDVDITVTDVNEAPTVASAIPAQSVERGGTVSVSVGSHFSDPGGDVLTYTASSSDEDVATVSASGGTVGVTGVAAGRADVTVTAKDPGGKTVSQSFGVTVMEPNSSNRAPAFASAAFLRSVPEHSVAGTDVGAPVTASDADRDTLSYSLATGGASSSFRVGSRTGQLTVAAGAALDYEGGDTLLAVSVVASDGALADTAEVTIRVTDVPVPGRPAKPVALEGKGEWSATWRAPSNAGPAITGYDLGYKKQSFPGAWTEVSVGDVTEHTVTDLPPGTAYLVRVRAVSVDGAGAWSPTSWTGTVPVFAPVDVTRSVAENSPPGTAVGAPVAAEADASVPLTYSLSNTAPAELEIDSSSGQIKVAEGAALDYESADTVHVVQVIAHYALPDQHLSATAHVTIRVTDVPPPGEPAAPVVTGGEEQVSVTWSAPENEGPAITGYDLRHRAVTASEWTVASLEVVESHTVTALDAGITYEVQVRAESSEGAGEWSDSGEGTTVVNRAPEFDAESYDRKVAENSAGGSVVGDPVTATDADEDALTYAFAGTGPSEFEIGASTGQIAVAEGAVLEYESADTVFAVLVEARDGALADTAKVTIRVTDVPAPGQPDAPTVTGGVGKVDVAWSAPANNGPAITAYHLRHRGVGQETWPDPVNVGAVTGHAITGLNSGTAYEVQVRAVSSEGAGEWSASGEGTTVNHAPVFGADAYERRVPENSPGGTPAGEPVTATDSDGDELTYTFAGTSPGQFEIGESTGQISVAEGAVLDHEGDTNAYTVSVVASDRTLADTASVTIRVTDVPAPGQPAAPTVTGGVKAVAVSWTAPANEGPDITGYHVRHRAVGQETWPDAVDVGAVTEHAITGLAKGTAYEVQVRASSSEGAGAWSESGEGTTAANRAPSFGADAYAREIEENSPGGTAVGEPVTATDDDGDALSYRLVPGGEESPFEIDAKTGGIKVAADAVLNYESGDTQYTVTVEASDGALAVTAPVTIRVTNADEPGTIALSPATARVGVELTATLTDEDKSKEAGKQRWWQRSDDGSSSWTDIAGARTRTYTPAEADAGKWLRAVFSYTDGHGPDKQAESPAVEVASANAAPSFPVEYEREVPENSPGGTAVGEPVVATDPDSTALDYAFVAGGDEALFEIDQGTGQITVAADAALDYESGDTLHVVKVEASDGSLADTATVKIRVTNEDEPGTVTLSPDVAQVGVEITVALTDEDGVRGPGRKRRWQRSRNGRSGWRDIGTARMYNPVTSDAGKWLRVVFTYTDGHGPDKRAVSDPVRVSGVNVAPVFGEASYAREVAENSPGGTRVGAPVTATDANGDTLAYRIVAGGDEAPFEIGGATGRIRVSAGAALNYESADTLFTLSVEASDGTLADTAEVTIRVTDADDPGTVTLSPEVPRVGVEMTAALADEDGVRGTGGKPRWQRSRTGRSPWRDVGTARMYNPVTGDEGKWLRALFTYTDGHGSGKRAASVPIMVVGAETPVVSFGAGEYTAAAGGSADVEVLVSPAATAALAVEVEAGDDTQTVTFQAGEGASTLQVSAAGLAASDTLEVTFGTLPDGVAGGVPAATRIVVVAAAANRAVRTVADDDASAELAVEYTETAYTATAGGPGTEIAFRISPAADRRVAVPLTAVRVKGETIEAEAAFLPDPVVFEPGDSLATFTLDIPAGSPPGRVELGFGTLPEAVSAGMAASATLDIAARDDRALLDEAFDVGLAVFGRAVAEGARQAIGGRFDAVMGPGRGGSGTAMPGSASEWAGRAAGILASLAGVSINPSSLSETARRSESIELPTAREAARRLLPSVSFATGLGPQAADGRSRLGLWAEGSAQSFRGEPGTRYDGGLRALTLGADARIGSSALLGVSLMRSDGDLDYTRRSVDGSLGHAMNSVHPYLFLRPSPGIGLWAMAGYGSGDVDDENREGDTGATLRMLSGGVKVPLARRGAFGLALAGDAFTVGMRAGGGDREGSASRARALLEASWTAGGLKLATTAGARYDGGDADTGGGAETGASVGYAGGGLELDLRGRLGLGSGGHREWGAALRLAFDPGTRGEGFRLALSPAHGQDQSGIHGLMDGGTLHAIAPTAGDSREWRLDAEAGYALKNARTGGALDGYTRLSAGAQGRALSVGTRYNVSRILRLGVEGSRTMLPGQPQGLGLRLGVDLVF